MIDGYSSIGRFVISEFLVLVSTKSSHFENMTNYVNQNMMKKRRREDVLFI
jgi:hypothetical protein